MASERRAMTDRFIVGLTGASGVEYGLRFLWHLNQVEGETDLIFSPNFFQVFEAEAALHPGEGLGMGTRFISDLLILLSDKYGKTDQKHRFSAIDYRDIGARAASGSATYKAMVIVPCSMKTLAAIAHGLSQNLIERAADVALKERRKLILCPRETPLSLIHLKNMTALTEAGATVMPLAPGYYHRPAGLTDLFDFMCDRIFSHMGLNYRAIRPWRS